MRKGIMVVAVLFVLFLFIGCAGPDGSAFLKYWWAGSLGYIYDTNTSTPDTIYNDVYFSTNPGSYYMEYESWDGSRWYMYYTVSIKKGGAMNVAGGDTWFEIQLLSTGPSLYEWDSARNMEKNVINEIKPGATISIGKNNENMSKGKTYGNIIGTEERQYINGSIKIEWGKYWINNLTDTI